MPTNAAAPTCAPELPAHVDAWPDADVVLAREHDGHPGGGEPVAHPQGDVPGEGVLGEPGVGLRAGRVARLGPAGPVRHGRVDDLRMGRVPAVVPRIQDDDRRGRRGVGGRRLRRRGGCGRRWVRASWRWSWIPPGPAAPSCLRRTRTRRGPPGARTPQVPAVALVQRDTFGRGSGLRSGHVTRWPAQHAAADEAGAEDAAGAGRRAGGAGRAPRSPARPAVAWSPRR